MTTWLKDANGNQCSTEYFGSQEDAQAALDSLKNCENCTNCSRCSDCSGCSGCSHIAWLNNQTALQRGLEAAAGPLGQPPIPRIENIHAAVLDAVSRPGALDMGDWHKCQNTHCRAGWVVHLAGAAGYALERFHNTALAAQLIYRESNPAMPVSPVRFFDPNDKALADIKRMAELEAQGAQGA